MRITPSILRMASVIVFHIADRIDNTAMCIGEIVIVIIILLGELLNFLNSHLSPNLVVLPFFTLTSFFSKRQRHGCIRKSPGLGQGTSLHSSLRSVTCVNERAHISQPCWPLVSSSCKMEVLH